MNDKNHYSPVQISIDNFGEVAKLAAIQELKIRLLANKTKAIEESAYEYHVSETSKKIIEHFKSINSLTVAEADLLTKSQTIRNKILHCEFNEAVKRIEALVGSSAPGPSVQMIKFDPNIGGSALQDILLAAQNAIATGQPGPHRDASTLSDNELGIFGGLINCAQRGALEMAYNIFKKSNDVLDRLMNIDTTITSTNSRTSLPPSDSGVKDD